MDCTPEIVDLVATAGCFAPHFHLPLQHASNRHAGGDADGPYTIEYYRGAGRRDSRAHSACVDWIRHHRRLSRAKPTTTSRELCVVSGVVAVDACARLSLLRPAGNACRPRATDKVHGSIVRERARVGPRHRPAAGGGVPRVADRNRASRPDARGWVAGRDGELSEGEDSARPRAQRMGDVRITAASGADVGELDNRVIE